MKALKLTAACINQTPMDWTGNLERIRAAVLEAKAAGSNILCLPELVTTGYGCEDMFLASDICERAEQMLEDILSIAPDMVVAVGLPISYRNSIFNTCAIIFQKQILGVYAKQNLAGDGVHYEQRWFKPWQPDVTAEIELCGQLVTLGDVICEVGGVRIGVEICEDAWVAERPGISLADRGVEIILNPSASHFAFGKQKIRERLVIEGSRAFGVAYVYANLLGNESGRVIFDGGAMISSCGDLLVTEKRFSYRDHTLIHAVVDIELIQNKQASTASRGINVVDFSDETIVDSIWNYSKDTHSTEVERKLWCKEEEFSRAVALALFDYMRKSYSRGFVLSLSGGADSSAIACLVKLALDFAIAELGEEGVREKLNYLKLPADVSQWMQVMLACVYQASENSGSATESSAESLAASLGAEYQCWDIASLVDGYTEMVSKGIGRQLTWQDDDIPLQNIQARVRAPGIWMLTNIRNGLLLSTSNRSEAAVGYATMDGDTCGGVSPISGIDKAFLRHWLKWLESSAMEGIERISALSEVNALQPTAELRPEEYGQTDESDLMPYSILDKIEKMAIRDKRKPLDCYLILLTLGSEYSDEQLKSWVKKFFQLWSRNQWKRERYAPSFHLDDVNLDPKTWCRFPILSAGFATELAELESHS